MSVLVKPPVFKQFTLALIQLGNIGSNKADNLKHARDMILKAVAHSPTDKKPDLIMLPVCDAASCLQYNQPTRGMFQLSVRPHSLSCIC